MVDNISEPELYELIVDYLRSEKLSAMEDEGLSQLLPLDDMLSDLLTKDIGRCGASQTASKTGAMPFHFTLTTTIQTDS